MRASRCVASLAAIGAGTGLLLACREVVRQEYLVEGLRRTSVWVSCRDALTGAVVGGAACIGAAALLWLWRMLIEHSAKRAGGRATPGQFSARDLPSWAFELNVFLAVLTAGAALAIPQGAPRVLGIPYRELVYCLGALMWIGGTALAAEAAYAGSAEEAAERWFGLRWAAVIEVVCSIGVLHGIVHAPSWPALIGIVAGVVGLCAVAFSVLRRSARPLHDRTAPAFGRLAMGRAAGAASLVVLLAVGGLWAVSWSTAQRARAEARHRSINVILIAVDALRADRVSLLSASENRRDLTPNLRRLLAPRATIFREAIASAPWTLPAFSSMFTGLDPREHGAEYRGSVLAPERLTLAEILRESGYRTLAVTSGAYVTTLAGMHQGFEHFDDSQALGQRTISSDKVTDKAIKLLRARNDEPFFLFLHYFDTHWVYQQHEEYPYARGYEGWLRDPAAQLNQEDFRQFLGIGTSGLARQPVAPEDVAFLADLYDGEVAYVDQEIGRLLEFVGDEDLWRNTLVIFVADHGEELFDHGNVGHQLTLFQESIHVPLAIAQPSADCQVVVTHPVETRALFSTVLDVLGLSPPAGRPASLLSGDDRRQTMARSANHTKASGANGVMFPEPVDVWWTSLQDERWKLIKEHLRGRSMLFDLASDPGERRNCAADNPQQKERLERELDRMDVEVCRRSPGQPAPQAGEEQKRRLKSLGYL